MTVKRFEFEVSEGGGEIVVSDAGGFVDYDDYQKLAALAEERRVFIVNGVEYDYIELPLFEDDRANATYQRCLLKDGYATADINAELRAQGVDALALHMEFNGYSNEASGARNFAANLRAGRKG